MPAMTEVAPRRATYRDVLDAPPHTVAEIVAGQLSVQPRPAMPHANAASELGFILGPPYQKGRGGPGGWVIVFEPEVHLDEHVLVPDLAGWRREATPDLDLTRAFVDRTPQWVCEVVSPSTARLDRVKKLPLYAELGVAHAWLVDPLQRTLEIFRLVDGRWSIVGGYETSGEIRAEPFDAIGFELSDLWVEGLPDPAEGP